MPKTKENDKKRSLADAMVTATEGGSLLTISTMMVGKLERQGIFKKVDGKYRLGDLFAAFVAYLRDETRRRSKSAAETRVHAARAIDMEARTAERLGRLVTIEDFEAMIDGICGLFRTELSGLPARICRDDLTERRRVENEVDGVLQRISDRANAIADSMGARRPSDPPVAAPLPG